MTNSIKVCPEHSFHNWRTNRLNGSIAIVGNTVCATILYATNLYVIILYAATLYDLCPGFGV